MIRKLTAILLLASPAMTLAAADVRLWEFDVYLNDKRVGTHRFEITQAGEPPPR